VSGITVVGLGPGDPRHLTREAWEVLEAAEEVWLRTNQHPVVCGLPGHLSLHSFDYLYDQADGFSEVYEAIVKEVLAMGRRPEGVVYAVPGSPLVGESTVVRLRAQVQGEGLELRVVEGLSFVEPTLSALGVDALSGLQICDGLEIAARYHPSLNPDMPALIAQLYDRALASGVKLTLMNQYPEDHPVVVVTGAGTKEQHVRELPLHMLDHFHDIAHLTALFVPALHPVSSFEGFQDTIAHLRAPDGCPWDREQTHESLSSSLLEETYETLAAIEGGCVADLREELGDLLLQVVLHAQIGQEEGEFSMAEVIAGVDAKLKHRHPHVWGDRVASGTDEVLQNWEQLKQEEKGGNRSVLEGVPRELPALQQASTYGKRAAHVGFDWQDPRGVIDKVYEEIAELQAAETPSQQLAEMGDVLFAVVNWARWLDIDPEAALRRANSRFGSRFRYVELLVRQNREDFRELSLEQLDGMWQEAKRAEKRKGSTH